MRDVYLFVLTSFCFIALFVDSVAFSFDGELKVYGTFFDELCLIMTPGRKTGEHTPRVNSFN